MFSRGLSPPRSSRPAARNAAAGVDCAVHSQTFAAGSFPSSKPTFRASRLDNESRWIRCGGGDALRRRSFGNRVAAEPTRIASAVALATGLALRARSCVVQNASTEAEFDSGFALCTRMNRSEIHDLT